MYICTHLIIVLYVPDPRHLQNTAMIQKGFQNFHNSRMFGTGSSTDPQVPSVTSVILEVQMFLPGTANVMSLLRSIQLAFAMVRLIE